MAKRKKPAAPKRAKAEVKQSAPLPEVTFIDGAVDESESADPEGVPLTAIDYIFADISECGSFPQGYRGWIVLTIGQKWVRLFSPALLSCHRLTLDQYDGLRPLEGLTYNTLGMLEKLRQRREVARKYGMYDGGKAADEAEVMCALTQLNVA
jgi:hypothetical protein